MKKNASFLTLIIANLSVMALVFAANGTNIFKIASAVDNPTCPEETVIEDDSNYYVYLINNAEDWMKYAGKSQSETLSVSYFKLTSDISVSDEGAIFGANSSSYFAGVIDGQGHTITANITSSSNTALIRYFSGKIKNLTVAGTIASTGSAANASAGLVSVCDGGIIVNCINRASVTGLGAKNAGIAAQVTNGGVVDGCNNYGTISGGTNYTGGIAAQVINRNSIVSNCHNYGEIRGGTTRTGGIVGFINTTGPIIRGCQNHGSIIGGTGNITAGIVSCVEGNSTAISNDVLIENCINYGEVSQNNSSVITAGILAYCEFTSNLRVFDCHNYGAVESISSYVGGIIASISTNARLSTIVDCSNHGEVIGSQRVGGIVGTYQASNKQNFLVSCDNYGRIISTKEHGLTVSDCSMTGGIVGLVRESNSLTETVTVRHYSKSSIDDNQIVPGIAENGDEVEVEASGAIIDCNNYGDIIAYSCAGGLTGYLVSETSFAYCYSFGQVITPVGVLAIDEYQTAFQERNCTMVGYSYSASASVLANDNENGHFAADDNGYQVIDAPVFGYPRLMRINSGLAICGNQKFMTSESDSAIWFGDNYVSPSKESILVANASKDRAPDNTALNDVSNLEGITLPDGRVAVFYRALSSLTGYSSIRMRLSNDDGLTFGEPFICLENFDSEGKRGMYEPYPVLLQSNEQKHTLGLYISCDITSSISPMNEYEIGRHEDFICENGSQNILLTRVEIDVGNSINPESSSVVDTRVIIRGSEQKNSDNIVNPGSRPGMSVVTKLTDGSYAMAVEDNVERNIASASERRGFVIQLSYSLDGLSWTTPKTIIQTQNTGFIYGTKYYGNGAPYVVTLPDGRIAVSCQSNDDYVGFERADSCDKRAALYFSDETLSYQSPVSTATFSKQNTRSFANNEYGVWPSLFIENGRLHLVYQYGINTSETTIQSISTAIMYKQIV